MRRHAGVARRKPPDRKTPNLSEKLASALLTICRPDAAGRLVPVIDPDVAKTMSVKQILAVFEFDHTVLRAFGGSNHPSNLVPRPVAEHAEKTPRDIRIVAKTDRVAPAHEEFRARMLAKAGQEPETRETPRPKRKKSIQSRGFQGSRNFKGTTQWKHKR